MAAKAKPLAGKRVVVTRTPEQAVELVRRLEDLGAEVILLPTVSFGDPEDPAPLDAALRDLQGFGWVLFTSQNAVRFFARRARVLGLNCRGLQTPRPLVAAVGPATARAAQEAGFRVDHVAEHHSGEALARELWGAVAGRRVLLPRSDRAGAELPAALREVGAEVVEIVAYRTVSAAAPDDGALERIRSGQVDVLSFASPSAFHHLLDELGREDFQGLAGRVLLAAIGPTTARAIREAGFPVAIEAAEATAAELAAAMGAYFVGQMPSGVKSQ